jgi:hypothetical protein
MEYDSQYKIGTRLAFKVSVCRTPANGILCEGCAKRPTDSGKHEPRLHGLLTEPIPNNSHIYGGSWYWKQVEKFGEPSAEWLESAKADQLVAEEWIEGAWTVSQGDKQAESTQLGMPSGQKKQKQKQKQTQKQTQETPMIPLTQIFAPKLPPLYKESEKPAETLPTEYYKIVKGEYNGIPVWILPNGKRFDMDDKGEPRNLI